MSAPLGNLKDLGRTGLEGLIAGWGQPTFRAGQIARWLYRDDVSCVDEMANLPAALKGRLREEWRVDRAVIEAVAASADGSVKFLVRFPTGDAVETVYIPTSRRTTICISSQTGCPMACAFCATGRSGPGRTLTPGEMVEELMTVTRPQPAGAGLRRPTHVVFMGMGEPLLDPRPLVETLRVLTWEHGGGYAARRITVSTCGIPAGIRHLADSGMKVRLALSLNAPWEGLRSALMPKAPPLGEVIPALRYYRDATGASVTLEYVLLGGVNDTPSCARGLAALARSLSCKVNLIAFNETDAGSFAAPAPARVSAFLATLLPLAPTVTVRHSAGADIAAACGQLAGVRRSSSSPHAHR